jgi:hypothetical protein
MNNASAVYCSGKYQELQKVFTCMGKCAGRGPDVPLPARFHCSDCNLLLFMLSRIGIGEPPRDSMIASLVSHNAIVNRWIDELKEEIIISTLETPHLLNNAIQARGISVLWWRVNRLEIAAGLSPKDVFIDLAWRVSAIAMHLNTCVPGLNPFRHRLHIVPHNAGLMVHDLIMLPFDAAPAHAVNVIERHTLPLETVP